MLKPVFKFFILACLFLLLLPVSTLAVPNFDYLTKGDVSLEQGDMRIGRIQLSPGLAFESSYESNIANSADKTFAFSGTVQEPTDDFIFTIKPSMRVALDRAAGEIFGFYVDYLGRDEHFLHEGDDNDFFNHRVGGGINLGGPGGRSDLTIGGSWNKSAGGVNRDLNSNIGNRRATTTTDGFIELLYSLSKIFKVQLRADATDEKFQGVATQNLDTYNLGGSIFWQATTPAAFGIKYNHRLRRYENLSTVNDDSDSDQVYLAVRWQPTSLISGELAVGVDIKRFDTLKGEDSTDLVYELNMDYTPQKRTRITLRSSREIPDSSFAGIQSLIETSFNLDLSQGLGKKFTLLMGVGLDNSDYRRSSVDATSDGNVKTRVDNTVFGTTALVYDIQKWLDARARYTYEENISNFDGNDFLNHIGILEIAAKY
jgi:hypothetical protein